MKYKCYSILHCVFLIFVLFCFVLCYFYLFIFWEGGWFAVVCCLIVVSEVDDLLTNLSICLKHQTSVLLGSTPRWLTVQLPYIIVSYSVKSSLCSQSFPS